MTNEQILSGLMNADKSDNPAVLSAGEYLVIDSETDATDTNGMAMVVPMAGAFAGRQISVLDPALVRALYDHATATSYGEGSYAVRLLPSLDWANLGRELRESAEDAHDGEAPSIDIAYSFLIDNPECFGYEEWPEGMPETAPEELQRAYGFVAMEVR